jgi:hypothetical protein
VSERDGRLGLLVAMMEPPSELEEEFNDWYDTEHLPERQGVEGVLTAARLVCVEGWPRYVALYDLKSREVLAGPGYAAITGENRSPWTRRMIPRVVGHYRAEAVQIGPKPGVLGAAGPFSRVVLWRFRGLPRAGEAALAEGMDALYGSVPETAQVRLFRCTDGAHLALVELRAPFAPPPGAAARLGPALRHVDMVNHYTPRFRG